MERFQGYYAFIQFGPEPDRQEFLNIGVLLIEPELGRVIVRVAAHQSWVERATPPPLRSHLKLLKAGIARRLELEFARVQSLRGLEEFASKRVSQIRLTQFWPATFSNPREFIEKLFQEMVGEDLVQRRRPRMARRLKEAFVRTGVAGYLDESPPPVDLPEAGISVSAPFGYQNGAYNLVDGIRLTGSPTHAMQEAGRRAIEGGLLWKHYLGQDARKRLVVVGDFEGQSDEFYNAVGDRLAENHVRLYRLDNLQPLLEDINVNAQLHG